MHDSTTDGVSSTVVEEPPPPRTVVVARRAIAAGIVHVVGFLLLAVWVNEQDHVSGTPEWVVFVRGLILIGLVASGAIAIYNYLRTRVDRLVQAGLDREFRHEVWESDQFQALHAADSALADAVRDLCRRQTEAVERQREMYERLHRENTDLTVEVRELRVLVAEHDVRSGRGPSARSRPRKRHRRSAQATAGSARGSNVVNLPSQETLRAARGLAARFIRDQQKRSVEDKTEDN